MGSIGRAFEWFNNVLQVGRRESEGPREYLETVIPTIPVFGTGRLAQKHLIRVAASGNTASLVTPTVPDDKVHFILVLSYNHTEALQTPDLQLRLESTIAGTVRRVGIDDQKLAVAQFRVFALTRPFLVPAGGNIQLQTGDGDPINQLVLEYLAVELELGEVLSWP